MEQQQIKFKRLDSKLHRLHRKQTYCHSHSDIDVFPSVWFLMIVNPKPNQLWVKHHEEWKNIAGPTALYSPAFGVIEYKLNAGTFDWLGYGSEFSLKNAPSESVLFPWNEEWNIRGFQDIENIFQEPLKHSAIRRCSEISLVASKTKQYLSEHFSEQLSIQDVATTLGFPYSTMTQSFKKAYGLSPKSYIKKIRIMYALHLIKVHGLNVTESCLNSGFSDISRFGQAFKNTLGRTPSRYEIF